MPTHPDQPQPPVAPMSDGRRGRDAPGCRAARIGALLLLLVAVAMPAAGQDAAATDAGERWSPLRRVACASAQLYLRPTDKSPYLGYLKKEGFALVRGRVKTGLGTWFGGGWRVYDPGGDRIGFVQDRDCQLFDDHLLPVEDVKPDRERFAQLYAEAEAEILAGMPLVITGVKTPKPDSAGGVDVHLGVRNLDPERPIKYLTVQVTPYDAVGEGVACSIRRRSTVPLEITGPITASEGEAWRLFEDVWYHKPGISCARVDRVEVEYLDGKRAVYVKDLPQVLAPWLSNDCSYAGREQRYSWPDLADAAAALRRTEELRKARFTVEADTVRDAGLGAVWSRTGPAVVSYEAVGHCQSLGEGWRLPRRAEAEAIYYPLSAATDNEELAKIPLREGSTPIRIRLFGVFEPTDTCLWAESSIGRAGTLSGIDGEFETSPESYQTCQALCIRRD